MAENIAAEAKAMAIVEAMQENKAVDIVKIDLSEKSTVTDYFVIGTFNTPTHLRDTREKIDDRLEAFGGMLHKSEGAYESGWVLLDAGDVVVHLMLKREREYYSLDKTWGDAPVARFEA